MIADHYKSLELPVHGMDCVECAQHVEQAIRTVPGVKDVRVYLASEKASISFDEREFNPEQVKNAVQSAGYSIELQERSVGDNQAAGRFSKAVFALLAAVFGLVLMVVVGGELLGYFELFNETVPIWIGAAVVLAAGYPVFKKIWRATLNRKIISHTLMSVGVVAALAVGQWLTALLVVVFMRVGDYVESYTTDKARDSIRSLIGISPETASVEIEGSEQTIPVDQVQAGDVTIVRPGEKIPVDGTITSGSGAVDNSSITGEPLPVDVGTGLEVFAASLLVEGMIKVEATAVGRDTVFGKIIRMVEEAEENKSEFERTADRFSGYFLPIVVTIAFLTFVFSRDLLAVASVLVVACSCAFALATPVAMLASIGAGSKRGILFKGGKYIELLEKADIVLLDKTGTLTFGEPRITQVILADVESQGTEDGQENRIAELVSHAAAAEKYSRHPLAKAVRDYNRSMGNPEPDPESFRSFSGVGVSAVVDGRRVLVAKPEIFWQTGVSDSGLTRQQLQDIAVDLEEISTRKGEEHSTLVAVVIDGKLTGLLTAEDVLRPEVPGALDRLYELGIKRVEIVTGDNLAAAQNLAQNIHECLDTGIQLEVRADLLPEDKIRIVKQYQRAGHVVAMVGDGINDAPALANSDVGIAMGAQGSDAAIEAAHITLMLDDWMLIPETFQISRKTMQVVRMNFGFTAVYNFLGLSLAAFGLLPPVFAAAAQVLPDLGIMANSSRLLGPKQN
jgi:Cd2+/Zn2+-exporting ATPase/Cu+-exporting ATPase